MESQNGVISVKGIEFAVSGNGQPNVTICLEKPVRDLRFLNGLPKKCDFIRFNVSDEVMENVPVSNYFVSITEDGSNGVKNGVMIHVNENIWCYSLIDMDVIKRNPGGPVQERSEFPAVSPFYQDTADLMKKLHLNVDLNETHKGLSKERLEFIESFTMKPPISSKVVPDPSPGRNGLSYQSEDPFHFIYMRYFDTLYSLKTPLSYFPKTGLSRLRVLCDNRDEKLRKMIAEMILPLNAFDQRHNGKLGLLGNEAQKKTTKNWSVEFEHREKFITNHIKLINSVMNPKQKDDIEKESIDKKKKPSKGITNEEKMEQITTNLKVRELQLQIVLLLELVSISDDETKGFFNNLSHATAVSSNESNGRKSLVRKKSQKRQVIPTFLGMGINTSQTSTELKEDENGPQMSGTYIFSTLSIFLEKLVISYLLIDDETLPQFITYIIVPFYNKKLPQVVKFITERVRNSKVRSKTKVKPKSKKLPSSHENSKESSTLLDYVERPVYKSSNKLPSLSRTSSLLGDIEMGNKKDSEFIAPKITRTTSSLSFSSKSFLKREIDMSLRTNLVSEKTDSETENRKPGSSIFNVKRSLSTINSKNNSISQVEATPSNNRVLDLFESIAKTPEDVQDKQTVYLIPDSSIKRKNIQQRLRATQVESSPIESPTKRRKLGVHNVDESPVSSMDEFSPSKQSKRFSRHI